MVFEWNSHNFCWNSKQWFVFLFTRQMQRDNFHHLLSSCHMRPIDVFSPCHYSVNKLYDSKLQLPSQCEQSLSLIHTVPEIVIISIFCFPFVITVWSHLSIAITYFFRCRCITIGCRMPFHHDTEWRKNCHFSSQCENVFRRRTWKFMNILFSVTHVLIWEYNLPLLHFHVLSL